MNYVVGSLGHAEVPAKIAAVNFDFRVTEISDGSEVEDHGVLTLCVHYRHHRLLVQPVTGGRSLYMEGPKTVQQS